MGERITGLIQNETLIRNLNKHQLEFNRIQQQLSTGKKINKISDNPSSAVHQTYLGSRLNAIDQFTENVAAANSRLRLIDGKFQTAMKHLQRVRELTVQASNGIYQGDNGFALREAIAREVDQHLRALVDIANSSDEVGRPLFGGYLVETRPYQRYDNTDRIAITDSQSQIANVVYVGDNGLRPTEIDYDQFINPNVNGSDVFWASNMVITAGIDSSGYVATRDQQIEIDSKRIFIGAGDTQAIIIDKINNATSSIAVSADSINNGTQVTLSTTHPHQLFLADVGDGTVLQDLGLINNSADRANNYAAGATISGFSLFGFLIKLREDLSNVYQFNIGGEDLAMMDRAMENILRYHSQVGAQQNRLEEHEKNLAWDKVFFTELYAQHEAIDFPESITQLRWLETVHQYALNVGARIIKPQLLDFLR